MDFGQDDLLWGLSRFIIPRDVFASVCLVGLQEPKLGFVPAQLAPVSIDTDATVGARLQSRCRAAKGLFKYGVPATVTGFGRTQDEDLRFEG